MSLRVMTIGMAPETVDFEQFPDLSPEKIRAGIAAGERQLKDAGYVSTVSLLNDTADPLGTLARDLASFKPDVVVVGAGLRQSPHLFLLFEAAIDLVHKLAPMASLGFNTRPTDTQEAIERALARRAV